MNLVRFNNPRYSTNRVLVDELLITRWIIVAILINCSSFLTLISKYSLINGTIKVASPISLISGFNSFIRADICLSFFF